jgi:hypothetical protein
MLAGRRGLDYGAVLTAADAIPAEGWPLRKTQQKS